MGGYGSGRKKQRRLVTECLKLNISSLKKQRVLGRPFKATSIWRINGRERARAELHGFENSILVKCQGHEETLYLNKTPCRFGGERYSLICPICLKNCNNLYFSRGNWCCLRCGGLGYPSENEGKLERIGRRCEKLLKQLGGDKYSKPKGMHNRTFDCLLQQYRDAEAKKDQLFVQRVLKMFPHLLKNYEGEG